MLYLHLSRSTRGYLLDDTVPNPVDITLPSSSYSLSWGGIFSRGDVIQQNVPQYHHKTPNTTLNHLYNLAVTYSLDTARISPVAAPDNQTTRQLPAQIIWCLQVVVKRQLALNLEAAVTLQVAVNHHPVCTIQPAILSSSATKQHVGI
jgi:hypothetical protein